MGVSYQKPPNGKAKSGSYLLVFDLDDEGQRKAWEIAQQLASQRKLKHVLVGMLLAIHTVQEQTGRAIDLMQFRASFITGLVTGRSGGLGMMALSEDVEPGELPSMFAGTEGHTNPSETRENFASGMGDFVR